MKSGRFSALPAQSPQILLNINSVKIKPLKILSQEYLDNCVSEYLQIKDSWFNKWFNLPGEA